ncbi:MAG: antibiotic biosynthesis monooxygenase [Stenomitos rutilans HA7619-LM2]|jgi:heme-degrading monooxygenase HmoA|nr:antibiotic biosynthesis monooxygenase [Stenomitos rutilans HA7619-LM2]
MVLEVAMLMVKNELEQAFETSFRQASLLIASMPGYESHELHQCLEVPRKYLLLVKWNTLEDHTIGFRQSSIYQTWKQLLHHFYDPFPVVEHFIEVVSCKRQE